VGKGRWWRTSGQQRLLGCRCSGAGETARNIRRGAMHGKRRHHDLTDREKALNNSYVQTAGWPRSTELSNTLPSVSAPW
jgi:hypothetical protein